MSSEHAPRSLAITGLDSFVGFRIAERYLDSPSPPRVVGIDLKVPRRLEGRLSFHRVDLTEPTADSLVAEVLEKERCDALLHAAFFAEPYPDLEYAHELEVIGSLHVMNAASAAGVRRMVVMSTAQVYGAHPDSPGFLTESHPLRPPDEAHALRDRAEVEALLADLAGRNPKLTVTSLRPCWVMGPEVRSQAVRHLAPARVTTLLGFDPLMQFLHAEDLLGAVESALSRDAPGAFNLAGDGVLPLSTLIRVAGKRPWPFPHPLLYRLAYLPAMQRHGEPPAVFYDFLRYPWLVDCTRARHELGFRPRYTTKEAWMSFVVSRRMRKYR
ncbi:MAG: NAD-dependent epimerase/dehydratase family protein [Myxococcota bacterium]